VMYKILTTNKCSCWSTYEEIQKKWQTTAGESQ
jgi:hypothetical protein